MFKIVPLKKKQHAIVCMLYCEFKKSLPIGFLHKNCKNFRNHGMLVGGSRVCYKDDNLKGGVCIANVNRKVNIIHL